MISVTNLGFAYGARAILADISFFVRESEIISILGKSGCGKTTLLRCLAGLLQPQNGVIKIDGLTPWEATRSQKIGYMFQEDTLLEWRSVYENVYLPFELTDFASHSSAATEAVKSTLEMVGLLDDADRFPFELSGGMRQRTALARSLAPRPAVMLLDEPFAALDMLTREEIMIELHAILKKSRTPTIVVTHHVEEATFLSDRILVLGGAPSGVAYSTEVVFAQERNDALLSSEAFMSRVIEIKHALRSTDVSFA